MSPRKPAFKHPALPTWIFSRVPVLKPAIHFPVPADCDDVPRGMKQPEDWLTKGVQAEGTHERVYPRWSRLAAREVAPEDHVKIVAKRKAPVKGPLVHACELSSSSLPAEPSCRCTLQLLACSWRSARQTRNRRQSWGPRRRRFRTGGRSSSRPHRTDWAASLRS